jgi:hypothetical protein
MSIDTGLSEGMKYGIVLFSFLMAYAEIKQAIYLSKIRKQEILLSKKSNINYIWVKWGLGIIGVYWAAYYIRSILGISVPLHQVFVRGAIFVTVALVASGALMSLRRVK